MKNLFILLLLLLGGCASAPQDKYAYKRPPTVDWSRINWSYSEGTPQYRKRLNDQMDMAGIPQE